MSDVNGVFVGQASRHEADFKTFQNLIFLKSHVGKNFERWSSHSEQGE